jgi:hypothetical protein
MRIQYELRYLDYLLFNVVHLFLSLRLQAVYLLLTGFIYSSERENSSVGFSLLFAAIVYAIMWIVQVIFSAIYLFTRRRDGNLTEHTIELRDDAFYESTRFSESRFFWPGILKVVRRPGYVAVYVAQHLAHVIPIRAFESKEQIANFVAFIREKMVAS